MARKILGLVLLVILIVAGVYWWRTHQTTSVASNGAVHCVGCMTPEEKARFEREDHGESADGNSERKDRTARADDAAGFPDAARKSDDSKPLPEGSFAVGRDEVTNQPPVTHAEGPSTMVRPEDTDGSVRPRTKVAEQRVGKFVERVGERIEQRGETGTGARQYSSTTRDSELPNAPSGERFGGKGDFVWYRQGDLTWRLNTVTGASCVDYATMEEWSKSIVMRNGCGRRR